MAGSGGSSIQSLELPVGVTAGLATKAAEVPKKKPKESKEHYEAKEPQELKLSCEEQPIHDVIIETGVLADSGSSLVPCLPGGGQSKAIELRSMQAYRSSGLLFVYC
ncbi:hypothetical protein NDU88_002071 [Pleurodeles waltl]|uniref:Uncharacterized protein n=1 Tax=Pleurodeles waltl TaxID=8319 RepID=A0AAV7NG24_PLEWA|nr:hypothetical protein NDU88_002071 [Pleurodeles waltl]